VLDGAGLYLAASTPNLAIRVRLARAVVPDLPVVPMGVTLTQGPIDTSIWDAMVQRARAAIPDEVLLAIIARQPADGELFVAAAGPYTLVEPQLDETGTGDWQPQQASRCAVRATPIPDAVAEVHSHHAMRAYFSIGVAILPGDSTSMSYFRTQLAFSSALLSVRSGAKWIRSKPTSLSRGRSGQMLRMCW